MRRTLVFGILLLFVVAMFKGTVFAEDNTANIVYDAQANEFSLDDHQDLFVELKSVVPSDNLTQNINLQISNLENGKAVKIYLQAENSNEDYDTLISIEGVNLTVNSNGESIEEEINHPLLIGYFSENGDVNIEVNLVVDKTVGNEIANLNAEIDWIFSAEIIADTDGPKTGDDSNVEGFAAICIISVGIIFFIAWIRRNQKIKNCLD